MIHAAASRLKNGGIADELDITVGLWHDSGGRIACAVAVKESRLL